jgi:hypothetical protein
VATFQSIEGRVGRGNVFVALNEREKALGEFDLAQQINPRSFLPYLARAEAADR